MGLTYSHYDTSWLYNCYQKYSAFDGYLVVLIDVMYSLILFTAGDLSMDDVYFHAGHQRKEFIQGYVNWILKFSNGFVIIYVDIQI